MSIFWVFGFAMVVLGWSVLRAGLRSRAGASEQREGGASLPPSRLHRMRQRWRMVAREHKLHYTARASVFGRIYGKVAWFSLRIEGRPYLLPAKRRRRFVGLEVEFVFRNHEAFPLDALCAPEQWRRFLGAELADMLRSNNPWVAAGSWERAPCWLRAEEVEQTPELKAIGLELRPYLLESLQCTGHTLRCKLLLLSEAMAPVPIDAMVRFVQAFVAWRAQVLRQQLCEALRCERSPLRRCKLLLALHHSFPDAAVRAETFEAIGLLEPAQELELVRLYPQLDALQEPEPRLLSWQERLLQTDAQTQLQAYLQALLVAVVEEFFAQDALAEDELLETLRGLASLSGEEDASCARLLQRGAALPSDSQLVAWLTRCEGPQALYAALWQALERGSSSLSFRAYLWEILLSAEEDHRMAIFRALDTVLCEEELRLQLQGIAQQHPALIPSVALALAPARVTLAQSLLLEALAQSELRIKLAALRGLGMVGGRDVVQALLPYRQGPLQASVLKHAAQDAILCIQSRLHGAESGMISLAEQNEEGQLSLEHQNGSLQLHEAINSSG